MTSGTQCLQAFGYTVTSVYNMIQENCLLPQAVARVYKRLGIRLPAFTTWYKRIVCCHKRWPGFTSVWVYGYQHLQHDTRELVVATSGGQGLQAFGYTVTSNYNMIQENWLLPQAEARVYKLLGIRLPAFTTWYKRIVCCHKRLPGFTGSIGMALHLVTAANKWIVVSNGIFKNGYNWIQPFTRDHL